MATLIVAGLGLTGVAASIATALISFAISYIAQSLFAPDAPETPPDQGVSARIPTDPKNKLPVVYGEQRAAGQTIFADISADNQKMGFIIALSEGPVEAIDSLTWEDKLINFATPLGSTLQSPVSRSGGAPLRNDEGDTKLTSGGASDENGVYYDFLDGNIKAAVFPNGGRCGPMETFSARWLNGAADRTMPNTAYAYIELTYDREKRVTGLPSKLYFNVKGREVRTLASDGTLTTGTKMSTNPVENLIDYMTNDRYGCNLEDEDLDLNSFSIHKSFCENPIGSKRGFCVISDGTEVASTPIASQLFGASNQSVANGDDPLDAPSNEFSCNNLKGFRSGSATEVTGTWNTGLVDGESVTESRYSTNGILNTNNELDKNISDLTLGNGGILTYNLGKFGLISEGTQSVAQRSGVNVSFSEDNIIGKLDITGSGFDAVLNEVTMKFTSKNQRYQQEQVVVSFDSVSETDTNTIQNPNEPRLEKTMQLPFTNNDVEARRIGRIIVNDSRQALIVSFQANIDNTDLQAGDIVEISHETPGWGADGKIGTGQVFPNNTSCTAAGGTVSGTMCINLPPKQFRVQQVDEKVLDQDNGSIGVSIIAREYAAAVYNAEMLLLQDPAPNTNLPNPLVIGDLNLAATEASAEINGVPKSQIKVTWTNTTFLDTVELRYIVGNLDATAIAALADNAWAYVSSDGDTGEFLLTDLQPETFYQIQARSRNTLGAIGTFGPIGDSDKIEVKTVPLDSIAPLDIFITSDAGGVAFKGATPASKEITATAFISGVVKTDAEHNVFNYRWLKDNNVMCLDGNTNNILATSATGSVQDSQKQCESAGGDWDDTRSATFMCHTTSTSGVVFPNVVSGCLVGNRADSENTGSTLTQSNFRTLTLGAEDFTDTTAITCTISNIT